MGAELDTSSSIERFLDDYWPMPNDLNLDRTGDELRDYLTQKHGEETVQTYIKVSKPFLPFPFLDGDDFDYMEEYEPEALGHEDHEISPEEVYEKFSEYQNFLHESGFYYDVQPKALIRARQTLEYLLINLESKDRPFTAVDLGSGDGKIAIGLALYLDNLENIYTLDISPGAIKVMYAHIEALPPEQQDIAKRKIVPIQGNYTSEQGHQSLLDLEPDGADVTINAHSYLNDPMYTMDAFARLTKLGGTIMLFETMQDFGFGMGDMDLGEDISISHLEMENSIDMGFGLQFQNVDIVDFLPQEIIIASTGQKIENV